MVWPENDYDSSAFSYSSSNDSYTFLHKAAGADKFRYSVNFAQSWSDWLDYEDVTTIDNKTFFDDAVLNWWDGQHVVVQCKNL